MQAVAVAFSMAWLRAGVERQPGDDGALGRLAAFRGEPYRSLTARVPELFELADAVLCADGHGVCRCGAPVRPLLARVA